MAKMAKLPQTDWTRGGHDISQTAIPLYQESLTNMGNILRDQDAARQAYIDKYYNASNPTYSDFLRAYNRNMAAQTANNYNATQGGYTTSGQRSYADNQRYMNDLAARLNQYGITGATNLVNSDLANLMNANQSYYDAYGLGKNYSAIETQNYLADKYNKNWWANALQGAGQVISTIPNPWTAGIGTAMNLAGGLASKDFSSAYGGMDAIYGTNYIGKSGLGGQYTNTSITNMLPSIANVDWGSIFSKRR